MGVISMVSSTASSVIVLFMNFSSFKFALLTRYAPSVRDMLAPRARYCFVLRNSDMFACGERSGKHATYKSSRPMRTQCAHVPKAHIVPQAYRLPQGKYLKSVRIYIALVCLLRQTN